MKIIKTFIYDRNAKKYYIGKYINYRIGNLIFNIITIWYNYLEIKF